MMESFEEFQALEQTCLDEGLLTPAFGRGNLRITKKGRELVKRAALADEEVADALQQALGEPLLAKRAAFVSLAKFARMRQPA